jgi:hypothetical protein
MESSAEEKKATRCAGRRPSYKQLGARRHFKGYGNRAAASRKLGWWGQSRREEVSGIRNSKVVATARRAL